MRNETTHDGSRRTQKSIAMTPDERKIIEAAAKSCGLSYSSYLRACALRDAQSLGFIFENNGGPQTNHEKQNS